MSVSLETLPGLFVEIAEQAKDADTNVKTAAVVRRLAARCALFVGVMQKMAAHIKALEAKLAGAAPAPAPADKPAEGEPEIETEALNKEASIDLDAEIMAMAKKANGGRAVPMQVVETPLPEEGAE